MEKTVYKQFISQIDIVDQLLITIRNHENQEQVEKKTIKDCKELEKTKPVFFGDFEYLESGLKDVLEKKKNDIINFKRELNRLDSIGKELQVELRLGIIDNDVNTWVKYSDLVMNTYCEHLNINVERLASTEYGVLVWTALSKKEEKKKNELILSLPFNLLNNQKITSEDLAASYYLILLDLFNHFTIEHNIVANTINTPDTNEKKGIIPKRVYDSLVDIFLTQQNKSQEDNYLECINALQVVKNPVITTDLVYRLGERQKGAFTAWFQVLKLRGRIKTVSNSQFAELLNNEIRELNLYKDGSTLGDLFTSAYKKYYTPLLQLIS